MKAIIENELTANHKEVYTFSLNLANDPPYIWFTRYQKLELTPVTNIWMCYECAGGGTHCQNWELLTHREIDKPPIPEEIKKKVKEKFVTLFNDLAFEDELLL